MNIPSYIPREIPRSKVRSWCIDEQSSHAKVIIVKPKDFKAWLDTINEMVRRVETYLTANGFTIINDEGEEHGKQHGQVPERNG
jgi:hypothetical protein